eukprot:jgi/Psemu1/26376/gm1.26376_g
MEGIYKLQKVVQEHPANLEQEHWKMIVYHKKEIARHQKMIRKIRAGKSNNQNVKIESVDPSTSNHQVVPNVTSSIYPPSGLFESEQDLSGDSDGIFLVQCFHIRFYSLHIRFDISNVRMTTSRTHKKHGFKSPCNVTALVTSPDDDSEAAGIKNHDKSPLLKKRRAAMEVPAAHPKVNPSSQRKPPPAGSAHSPDLSCTNTKAVASLSEEDLDYRQHQRSVESWIGTEWSDVCNTEFVKASSLNVSTSFTQLMTKVYIVSKFIQSEPMLDFRKKFSTQSRTNKKKKKKESLLSMFGPIPHQIDVMGKKSDERNVIDGKLDNGGDNVSDKAQNKVNKGDEGNATKDGNWITAVTMLVTRRRTRWKLDNNGDNVSDEAQDKVNKSNEGNDKDGTSDNNGDLKPMAKPTTSKALGEKNNLKESRNTSKTVGAKSLLLVKGLELAPKDQTHSTQAQSQNGNNNKLGQSDQLLNYSGCNHAQISFESTSDNEKGFEYDPDHNSNIEAEEDDKC